MARFRHKHVLRTRKPHRGRLIRLGLAAAAVPTLAVPTAAIVWTGAPLDSTPLTKTAADRTRTSPVPMRVATPSDAESLVELAEKPSDATGQKATRGLEVRTRTSGKARPHDKVKTADEVAATGKTQGAEVTVGSDRVRVEKADLARTATPTQETYPDPLPTTRSTPSKDAAATSTKPATKSTTRSTKKRPADKSASAGGVTSTTNPPSTPSTVPSPKPAPLPTPTSTPKPAPTPTPTPTPTLTDAPSADPTYLPGDTCATAPDAQMGPTAPVLDPETCLPLPW